MDNVDEELYNIICTRISGTSINDQNWYATIAIIDSDQEELEISKHETVVDLKIPIINIEHKEAIMPSSRGTPIRLIDVEESFLRDSVVTVCYRFDMEYTSVSHPSSSNIMEISYGCAKMHGTYEQKLERYVTSLGGLNESRELKHLLNDMIAHRVHYCWIDALCIDQSNDEEVSPQILSMASIYNIAKQTVVYTRYIGATQNILDREDMLGRWFSRVWTFQEAVFCRNPLVAVSSNTITKYIDAKEWYIQARKILNHKVLPALGTLKLRNVARQMSRLNTAFGHLCGPASGVIILESDVIIETADRECKYHVDRINGIIGSLSVSNIGKSFQRSEEINDLYYATEQLMENCDYKLRAFMLCCPRLQILPGRFKSWLPTMGKRLKLSVLYKNPDAVIECVVDHENTIILKTHLPHIGCIVRIEDRMPKGMCTCKITVGAGSLHNTKSRRGVHTYVGDAIFDLECESRGCVVSDNELIATLDTGGIIDNRHVDNHACMVPICFNDMPQERGDMKRCNALLLSGDGSTLRKAGILSIPTTMYLEAAEVTCDDIVQGLKRIASEYVFCIE